MAEPCERIVLLTVDSLRADALGLYGGEVDTPNIDALAAGGLTFERAFATGSHTTQSLPGILASNYPTTGGSVQTLGGRVSVAECFRAAGWRTAAFHSNPLLSARRGYGRGFDDFWDSLPPGGPARRQEPGGARVRLRRFVARRLPWLYRAARALHRAAKRRSRPVVQPHESAAEINRRVREWLSGNGGRFFLWVHYMDPHWPYGLRLPGLGEEEKCSARELAEKALNRPRRLTPDELERLKQLYRRDVAYLDREVGALVPELPDRTAVVLTSDHGQAFMEHGTCFHGDLLYEELLRVPLIVRAPEVEPGRRTEVASLIDLAPTLCRLAGIEPPPTFEGSGLLEGGGRDCVFAETAYRMFVSEQPRLAAARTDRWKLIRDRERKRDELYDLDADPGETRDLSGSRGDVLSLMASRLKEHLRRERPAPEGGRPAGGRYREEDETVKARLRALGYMDEAGD